MISFDYLFYDLTEIDEETSLLKIHFLQKNTEYFYITIELDFDIGASAFFYLTIIDVWYNIYVDIYPENAGWVWGAWTYSVGEEVNLEADAEEGYIFQNWRIDGIVVSSENPYIFIMPDNDVYISAHFISEEEDTYSLILLIDTENAGTVIGEGEFYAGEQVTINATPNAGFEFVKWTYENEELFAETALYNFSMTEQNLVLIANFIDINFVETDKETDYQVYPNPFSDYIYIDASAELSRITISQITGQIIINQKMSVDNVIDTSNLPSGFYLMIIETVSGERIVKKIIKQ